MEPGPLRTELMALAAARRRAGARRAGRRRVAAHPRGQRLRVRPRARPGGSSSTTRCCARRHRPRWRRRGPRARPRQGPRRVRRHADRRARRRARGGRALPARLVERRCCARPASTRSPNPRAIALLVAVVAVAGLVSAPAQALRVAAGRGPRRRARAGADRRPGDVRVDAAPAVRGQPRRPRPAAVGVPVRRVAPVHRGADGGGPGLRAGGEPDDPHPAGHQRLPAPARRHPVVRAQARGAAAGRLAWWSTRRPGGARRSSTPTSRSRWSASRPRCCCRRRTVARRAAEIARAHGCDTVWFGAAAPLGLLAGGLRRRAGIGRAVALTHGHEVGWAALPGARTPAAAHRPRRRRRDLPRRVHPGPARPGAARPDRPAPAGARRRHRRVPPRRRRRRGARPATASADRPVVVCVSRLVPRKGQDTLIRALPAIRRRVPDARAAARRRRPAPRPRWRRLAGASRRRATHVVFTGSVPWEELPGALRGRRRVRDAVPHPARRPRRRGPRHRLPGGVGDRAARRRPATRAAPPTRCARARPATWSTAATSRRSPTGWPRCSPTATLAAPDGRGRAGVGGARVALGHPGRADARPAGGRVRPARVRRHAGCGIGHIGCGAGVGNRPSGDRRRMCGYLRLSAAYDAEAAIRRRARRVILSS